MFGRLKHVQKIIVKIVFMNLYQHGISATMGFVTTAQVVQSELPELPKTKSELLALVSAVVVQSLIFGVSKFFGWLKKKNEPKTSN